MTRYAAMVLVAGLTAGCLSPTAFIFTADAKPPEGAKTAEKIEVRYRAPVLASQVTAENAKAKAVELQEELDRDLSDLVDANGKK